MIAGFNTDVEFNDKVYHVQTEDRRSGGRVLETLVYVKGQILDSVKTPYGDEMIAASQEPALAATLEAQHKQVIRWIRSGRYDPEGIEPFGTGIISDLTFEEVVLRFIEEQALKEKAEVQVEQLEDLRPGWTGALRIHVRTESLGRPLAGAQVDIRLESAELKRPLRLARGEADEKGALLAEIVLPDKPRKGEVLVAVRTERGDAETRLPLEPA